MLAVLWPIVVSVLSWLFRKVVITFVVLGAVIAVVELLMPYVWDLVVPANVNLASLFSTLSPQTWWWLDLGNLAFGLPLVFSAVISKFIIRRIPFVG